MKDCLWLTLLSFVVLSGCADQPANSNSSGDASSAGESTDAGETADAQAAMNGGGGAETTGTAGAVAGDGGEVALTPDNTTIQFVGIHVGDKPDPRTGRFAQFSGTAVVAEGELKSVSVEIDTTSVTTDIEKLTNHLKSPDFFDVNEHPTAKFQSTSIESAEDGVTVTGDLTLLGQTQSISFPATVSVGGGLELRAEFTIDRTKFGMEYGVDKVAKEVSMTISVK